MIYSTIMGRLNIWLIYLGHNEIKSNESMHLITWKWLIKQNKKMQRTLMDISLLQIRDRQTDE